MRWLRALLVGGGLGLLALAGLLVAVLMANPWFLDAPLLALALLGGPAALAGGMVGLLLQRWLGRVPAGVAGVVALAGVASLPLLGWTWPRPAPVTETRLLVFGLDGASWSVLDDLGADLPHLHALRTEGSRAVLRSMEPMFSPLLWATISTGVPPEVHGIHGFRVHADDCRAARFWEVMEAEGHSVGIYKWLVTYPPARVDGFLVPAWLAPGPETWPPELSFVKELELANRLKRKSVAATRTTGALLVEGVRHGLRFSTVVRAGRYALALRRGDRSPEALLDNYREAQWLRVWMDRDVFVWALHRHRPEVATFTDYATDALGHRFWKYHEPERFSGVTPAEVARWGEVLRDTYRQGDAVLGEIRAELGPQVRVVLVSDHGFQALDAAVAKGFFAPRTEVLRELISQAAGPVEVNRTGHKLVVTVQGDDVAGSRVRITEYLGTLLQESTGAPLYRWEDVPEDPRSLGLTLQDEELDPARIEADRAGGRPLSDFVRPTEPDSGVHAVEGVFLAAGPGVARGVALPELSLLDVAPVVLAFMDLPASQEMTGRVPPEIWAGDAPELGPPPPSWAHLAGRAGFLDGEEGVDEERLKALGYVE